MNWRHILDDLTKGVTIFSGLAPQVPMAIGTIASIVQLFDHVITSIKSEGADIEAYAVEKARFDAAIAEGIAADIAWRVRNSLPLMPGEH